MNRCPKCNRTYTDNALNFCLEDGTPLVPDATTQLGGRATFQPPPGMQPWSPMPPAPLVRPQRKSNAIWWLLGGVTLIAIVGVVMVVILIAIASNSSSTIQNTNSNKNTNANRVNANNTSSPSASPSLPSSFKDDFSTKKWSTETSDYGELWYANDEYHMRAKEKNFLLICAPNNDYNTEKATVRLTVRNVDGISPPTGYGLMVHCAKGNNEKLDNYVFLIYTGERPKYSVVLRRSGAQTTLVPWTESSTIRSGTSPNQLEVRTTANSLSFYVNSQYLTSITDSANLKRGLAGFYASDAHEVAFDDLEITR